MAFLPPTSLAPDAQCELSPSDLSTLPFPCAPAGQKWALISCVAPPGWGTKRTANTLAVRIYGCFETRKDAEDCMKRAVKMGYSFFDMWPVPMEEGFIPLPPPAEVDMDNIQTFYDHPTLQEIMRGHRDIINESSERILARIAETPASEGAKRMRAAIAASGAKDRLPTLQAPFKSASDLMREELAREEERKSGVKKAVELDEPLLPHGKTE